MFTPVSVLMIKYGFTLLGAIRYSPIFIQHEVHVDNGKPWSASDAPLKN